MAVNPFFLHGSSGEQSLVQDLINEQLKMYGIDVYYLPRTLINVDNIFTEVESSKFDTSFIIEAYINNYDGYTGAGDIMTKFGMSLRDEVNLIISKERFEEFIAPILQGIHGDSKVLVTRPREGDLIYFPLGQRLFEIKFVEHEKPFYQLKKTYVYELQCELFEYEGEDIDTTIDSIDKAITDESYSILTLIGSTANNAEGTPILTHIENNSGFVKNISLTQDGYNYTSAPTVSIEASPVGLATANATAVAITTSVGDAQSVYEIYVTNTGYGYTTPPAITLSGGGGVGAAATAILHAADKWISRVEMLDSGSGYRIAPSSIVITPPDEGYTAPTFVGILTTSNSGSVSQVAMRDAGTGGYNNVAFETTPPSLTIADPFDFSGVGGNFQYNETVTGSISGVTALAQDWDINTMKLKVSSQSGQFLAGETITGSDSTAKYGIDVYSEYASDIPYSKNDEFEQEADQILDFSEDNPFGTY